MIKRLLLLLAVVVAIVAIVVLSRDEKSPLAPPSNVDVAAPDIVAIKHGSAVEDCPVPGGASGPLPEITLPCLGGGTPVDLSTLQGPLVLNFFQSACEPCEQEMPALQAFHERYGDRVPIIGIDSQDTYPGVALQEAISRGVTYPMLADPGGDLQGTSLHITGYPQFWILREDGEMVFHSGGLKNLDEVRAMVEDALGIRL